MADAKDPDFPKQNDPALEKRVDAMMDPKKTPAKPVAENGNAATPPPINIFTDPTTAPEITGEASNVSEVLPPAASEPTPTTSAVPAGPEPASAVEDEASKKPAFDTPATDKAVDDIVSNESDTVLAAEDAAARPLVIAASGWKSKLKTIFKSKRTWVLIVVLLLVVFGLPVTRYKVLGLVIKKSVTLSVVDSKTHTPVSNAVVRLAGVETKTDANGKAKVHVPVGNQPLLVSKQYFTSDSEKFFVGFKSSPTHEIHLVATGRQVPITVLNAISGKPLANAEIKVLDTTAKTNKKGQASIVLPTKTADDSATVQLSGYNQAKVTIKVTSEAIVSNTFKLTPSGHIYFLSNLNGTIDVVKTNLDGSNRQVVVAGTGKEEAATTSLLATRDWKYVVLQAKRDNTHDSLYLIDTSNDHMTQFDNTNASFTLVGWYGHNFVYDLVSKTVPASQPGHEMLKSYDAENTQLNQLDQSQAEGQADSYAYQGFGNFYILSNSVVYSTQWYTYTTGSTPYDVSSKTDSIRAVQPGHQNKKDYQTFSATDTVYIRSALYAPQAIHFDAYNQSDNKTTYYNFENQAVTTATNIDDTDITKTYPTYLASPSDSQTFWTELRDGKNTLFVGDNNAGNRKQIASLSDYSPYGWFGDSYVLVSKDSSQLYIMPVTGLATGQQPLKITDYYKPTQNYTGYGYGYGGL